MGQIIRGDTIHDKERIKLLNKIIAKLKEIEESIPVKIRQAIDALVDNSPEAYDTLRELYEGLVLQPDWEQDDDTKLDYIKNKPEIPEQVKSDWDESDNTKASFINNRPFYEIVTFTGGSDQLTITDQYNPERNLQFKKDEFWEKGYLKVLNDNTGVSYIKLLDSSYNIVKNDVSYRQFGGNILTKNRTDNSQGTNLLVCYDENLDKIQIITDNSYHDLYDSVVFNNNNIANIPPRSSFYYDKLQGIYEKVSNLKQLDIKYIPDSLIQRIEACEQALNITPNS